MLLETESRCIDTCCAPPIRDDLDACKTHCKKHGARRLTYFSHDQCWCCTDSSEIVPDPGTELTRVNVYECIANAGNCIYFPN